MGAHVCTCDVPCEAHPDSPHADALQDRIDAAQALIREHLVWIVDEPVSPDRMTHILQAVYRALDGDREAGDE